MSHKKLITKSEFAEAKEIVDAYKKQENAKYVSSYTCVNCKENEISCEYPEYINPLSQAKFNWNNGTVAEIAFGYGSKHDMSNFYIAICDDCITDLVDSGLAINKKELRKKIQKGV